MEVTAPEGGPEVRSWEMRLGLPSPPFRTLAESSGLIAFDFLGRWPSSEVEQRLRFRRKKPYPNRRPSFRLVLVMAASSCAAKASNPGLEPRHCNSSTSSKSGMSVRRVASVRKALRPLAPSIFGG
jgi:hypothetical protein